MNVGVLGAGTMGHGIAQVAAMAGHDVTMRDVDEDIVADGIDAIEANLAGGVKRDEVTPADKEATLARVEGTTDLGDAVADADLVVEAVPEDLALKKETFRAVEELAPDDCVVASNTSSLPVTELAAVLDDPGRAVGLHFFNPPHVMPPVEVVLAEQTSDRTGSFAVEFVEGLGKEPVVVKDAPGFATSRLGVALGAEAMRMVEAGVATPAAIDRAMELGYDHPVGPLELTDRVGLDVRLDISEHLRGELGERFRPPQVLRRKVRAGKLGRKTGEGFYVWEDGERVGVAGEDDG